tara:strand:+ start:655 stop:837 length:183 start_codon:yes stop_codon:yes gene_type:complete
MANSKTDSSTVTVKLFKEHKHVVQFREADQDNATIKGGVYFPKAYIGKAKSVEITTKKIS